MTTEAAVVHTHGIDFCCVELGIDYEKGSRSDTLRDSLKVVLKQN